jgi:predicted MFS family arabinose efflux permease
MISTDATPVTTGGTPAASAAATATRGFFLLVGIASSTWAPMVPLAKARIGLDEAQLGLALVWMGIGSVAGMPLAGFLTHRYGNHAVMVAGALLVCASLPLLSIAPSAIALGATLAVFGGALGVVDVAMNAHAVEVERLHRRQLMSGFHGVFSLGGLVGSVVMIALLGARVPLVMCVIAVTIGLLAIIATQRPKLLAHVASTTTTTRALLARPPAIAFLLGALCFVVFLAEGAILDWSAVFLRSERGLSIATAGLGYAAFSVAMAVGRLLGDRITAALGPLVVVRAGGLVAALGFLLATALPWPATSLVGFVLVGLGAANIVPVLFSAAGRMAGPSVGMSLATVTGMGYSGVLAGPAAIGFVAHATSLPLALGGIAALLLGVALCASIVRR